MDFHVPTIEDHFKISILVKSLGPKTTTEFDQLIVRLSRIDAIQVSVNPKRMVLVNFVTDFNPELTKFGDLQAHRKIFGFIGVAINGLFSFETVWEQYNDCKSELYGACVDSRCFFFGFDQIECGLEQQEEVLFFNKVSEDFEIGVRELIQSIYFVLESRRIDTSFEKMEHPPCPTLPDEEKIRMGTENKQSRSYRKKCVGRLRKQAADYALLTGLPSLALDSYYHAIEYLKSSSDLLWLAAAYEGYACAAMTIKFNGETPDRWRKQLQYKKQKTKISWGLLNTYKSFTGRNTSIEDIIEKFSLALEHYDRFSFVSFVEYECMVRTTSVYRHHRKFIEAEAFLREHVGKYLDDNFTLFDNTFKAHICMVHATIFKEMGFRRKASFYSRLAVLFRLHVSDNDNRTEDDYKFVYPILYHSLPGYGINDKEASTNGPVVVQLKAINEVYVSAIRAGFCDAAIRHLCFILQVYFLELGDATTIKTLDDLLRLVNSQTKIHSLAEHISLDQNGIVLPPLQMTRFPTLCDFKIVRLSQQIAPPRMIPTENSSQKVFIYSPFETDIESNDTYWVTNYECQVSVKILNPLPVDLTVTEFTLITDGCSFEAVPTQITLPPYSSTTQPTEIILSGTPRFPGNLSITGYSCMVLGVQNVCAIKETLPSSNDSTNSKSQYTVDVLEDGL